MTDLLMVVIFTAFFALAVLFVRGCERIVGTDAQPVSVDEELEPGERAAA